MRFLLTLHRIKENERILPINYQYELSSWIYRVIGQGDSTFSAWLHDKGYADDKKRFRLFTFANLMIPQKSIRNDRIIIKCDAIHLIVSFLPHETISHFIQGLFTDQVFRLGDQQSQVSFRVSSVEGLPEPDFQKTMTFRALSPILVTQNIPGERHARYLPPDHQDYPTLLLNNLKEKWLAFKGQPFQPENLDRSFSVSSVIRKKGILIKAGTPAETKLIGYLFDFTLTAPSELIRLGYYSGFGEKNSMGFGCVEVEKELRGPAAYIENQDVKI